MANLIPFTKRFESSENLVNLLESRGLQICDRNKAIQYLDNIGYYRLSAYMYPLLKMPKTAHLYKEGSTFKKVMMLYRFDKKLRLLMFNEIEKIEIAIRRAVMQITADMTGNPFSILNCFNTLELRNFWFASGTPTYLVRLLAHSNENINELVGKYYDASQFIDYKADVEQPLPMIYQSGYITIKDCNIEDNTYLLDFPNEEVRNGFIDTVASRYFANITQNTSWVLDVTDCLRKGDTAK